MAEGTTGADRTWELIERHFEPGTIRICPMAPEGEIVTPQMLTDMGERLGVKFPEAYVAHVCGAFPGVGIEVFESIWPRPQQYEIGPLWLHCYGFHTMTPVAASEDWMRVDLGAERIRAATGLVAAPVLTALGAPDIACVDASGALCAYCDGKLTPLEGDFWDVLDGELAGLAERMRQRIALAST